jgi:hypothetical protein
LKQPPPKCSSEVLSASVNFATWYRIKYLTKPNFIIIVEYKKNV